MPDWKKAIEPHLKSLNLSPTKEFEIIDELSQHLTDKYQEFLRAGSTTEEAEKRALEELNAGELSIQLGSVLKKDPAVIVIGEPGTGNWLRDFVQDVRMGIRFLRTNWLFTVIALLSLALGVGANTSIFQLLNAVRLRSLPVERSQELASMLILKAPQGKTGAFVGSYPMLTYSLYENFQKEQQGFSSIAAWSMQRMNLSNGGEAQYAQTLFVNGDFFKTLGVKAQMGRLIGNAEDRKGCAAGGAVLSDSFWHSRFGGNRSVLGKSIWLEGLTFEVIGVTPPQFFGVEVGRNFDVAVPLCVEPLFHPEDSLLKNSQGWWLGAIGRLNPGWTLDKASAQLQTISSDIFRQTTPEKYDAIDKKNYQEFKLEAISAQTGISHLRRRYETPLWLLLGISAAVLLIACANLANLMVAMATSRSREMAVRVALGASRSRLIRQLITESLLLASVGALLGAALAQVLSRVIVSFLSTQQLKLFLDLQMDWRVLGFTALLAILTCLIFGLLPAIHASRTDPGEAMKANSRGNTVGRGGFQARGLLVVSQVALSLVLMVGALLFIQTFRNLSKLDAGFQQDRILAGLFDLTPLRIPPERRIAYKQELLDKIRAIPGVQSAANVAILPLSGSGWNETISIPELNVNRQLANFNQVSSDYFRTVGTRFLAGRDFNPTDTSSSPLVAIVTETFARQFCKGCNPVGMSFRLPQGPGTPDRVYQIIGYVKDAKYISLREDFTPIVFVAELQDQLPDLYTQVVVRSDLTLNNVLASVKHVTSEMNPSIVISFKVFQSMIREGLVREQLMATISGFFGFVAAVLAMIGIYGVISFMVARRRNEIGIRMALGAGKPAILRMIFHEAGLLLTAGLSMGIFLTLIVTKSAKALLYGMEPGDPWTLLLAAAGLASVAIAASLVPAHRAATLNPTQALREE